ncbi:MAG: hypothetical protein VX949_04840 [Planctomycetota bacterium]|nr:hypothetical protein [Planctomycetota bacterium]
MTGRPDGLFDVDCPCCETRLTIDPRARRIFHVVTKGADGASKSFEEAVKDATGGADRAAEKFKDVLAAEEGKEERLDDLFEDGLKKAEEDPNKKPPSIFDFD